MRFSRALTHAVALAMVLAAGRVAHPAEPIELVGGISLAVPAGGFITNVWGWVHPVTQREYAIVGSEPFGIFIVDVTNPANPVLTKHMTNVPGFDMKTRGIYLYLCDGDASGGNDSRIVDLTDPANPVLLPTTFPTAHSVTISDAGMMYINFPSLRALDLATSATAPTVWLSSTAGGSISGHDTTCRGDRVFDFTGNGGGTRIFRLTGPRTLSYQGTCFRPGLRYYHSGDMTQDGTHLFVTDELALGAESDITVFDIDPLNQPVVVTELFDPTATAHNLFIVGDVAYVSYYTAGFKAFNVSNPAAPSLIGRYDTTPFTGEGYTIGGGYGVYPFSPSGTVFVSDMDNGLFILRLTTTTAIRFPHVTARATHRGVMVEWAVEADEVIEGFRVYRATEPSSGVGAPVTAGTLPPGTRAFVDAGVAPGTRYSYTIAAVAGDGSEQWSAHASVDVPAVSTGIVSVHPNPFNPSTTVAFDLTRDARVRMQVVDTRGALVRTLSDRDLPAGRHEIAWDGRDDAGRGVASGVYFARLTAGTRSYSRRMVLLK